MRCISREDWPYYALGGLKRLENTRILCSRNYRERKGRPNPATVVMGFQIQRSFRWEIERKLSVDYRTLFKFETDVFKRGRYYRYKIYSFLGLDLGDLDGYNWSLWV